MRRALVFILAAVCALAVLTPAQVGEVQRLNAAHKQTGVYITRLRHASWAQVIPYTDRLNYVSPLINNFGYCAAVEKLLGMQITDRCKYLRVLMSEISRVTDHLTCIAASAMELGAITASLYLMKAREFLYELVEEVTGARLTISYGQTGGVKGDLPEGFAGKLEAALKKVEKELAEVHKLLTRNRIWVDRTRDIGILTREDALTYGITGPLARASGIDYDVWG